MGLSNSCPWVPILPRLSLHRGLCHPVLFCITCLFPQGTSACVWGHFYCHSGQNSGGGGALGVPWVEVKDAGRYSVVGRAVPTAKSCSFENVSTVEVEGLGPDN